MAPLDILRAVSMFRLMNPKAEIKVCAGRTHLRDLQSMVFLAGAPITVSAVRQLYGLHGIQEWGKVIHCAMVGIPGPVPQD